MAEKIERTEFRCPRCGGSHFGSTQLKDESYERHCHGGRHSASCSFTWSEKDDYRYFLVVTEKRCETKEEYDRELSRIRPRILESGKESSNG